MPAGIVEISKKNNLKFKGYVTAPASGVYPGILLLHQEFGIEPFIRYIAEYLSLLNYTVFVPDIFWRKKPGCELNFKNKGDVETSKFLLNSYNTEDGLGDITTCLKWLRETPQCNGLVSTIGYGIGANLSYLAGLWLDIESSVCYEFSGCNFFSKNDTFIRRPMLIHLSTMSYDNIKNKGKIEYIENVNNIDLKIHEASTNFYKISDKNYDEEKSIIASKQTIQHIAKAFKNPHNI